jgi:hypothetical protein
MNVRRWMESWQVKFGQLGVELMVADVGQSSVHVDVAEARVVLAPSLRVSAADRMLDKVYVWWLRQPQVSEERPCSLVTY